MERLNWRRNRWGGSWGKRTSLHREACVTVDPPKPRVKPKRRCFQDPLGPLGPPPKPSSPSVSKSMKSNRSSATVPELRLSAALLCQGTGRFRTNWSGVPGRPDVAFPAAKLAVFVHGCYWHRCPRCHLPLPKTHRAFWKHKFERNEARDRRKVAALRALGWTSLIVWECELRDSPTDAARRIQRRLRSAGIGKAQGRNEP